MRRNIVGLITALVVFIASDIAAMNLEDAKKECLRLGFEGATEQYGDCVLQLYTVNPDQQALDAARARSEAQQRELEAAAARAEARKAQAQAQAEIARIRRQQSGASMMQFGLELMDPYSASQETRMAERCFSQPNGVGGYIVNCD